MTEHGRPTEGIPFVSPKLGISCHRRFQYGEVTGPSRVQPASTHPPAIPDFFAPANLEICDHNAFRKADKNLRRAELQRLIVYEP